MSLEMASKKNT